MYPQGRIGKLQAARVGSWQARTRRSILLEYSAAASSVLSGPLLIARILLGIIGGLLSVALSAPEDYLSSFG